MILPPTAYLQIGSQQPFARKSGFFQHTNGALVFWNTGRFDPVQAEACESVSKKQRKRFSHQSLPGKSLAHPITDMTRLRDAAANIADRNSSCEGLRAALKDQESHPRTPPSVGGVLAHSFAPRTPFQFIW